MMLQRDLGNRPGKLHVLQHLVARLRVPLDQLELGRAELAGLGQDLCGYGDLADIVQITRNAQSLLPVRVQAEFSADRDRNLRHFALVAGGVRIAHFAQSRRHLHRAHEGGFELRDVILNFLFGALFFGDVLHQADDRRPALVDRARAVHTDFDHGAVLMLQGKFVSCTRDLAFDAFAHTLRDPVAVLLSNQRQRVATDQSFSAVAAGDFDHARIDVGKLAVLDNVYARDRLLDQAAKAPFAIAQRV